MIEVCCAILLNDKKVLAVQREPESSHPWKWEFPGGKIILDETPEECIIREIVEELTVRIELQNQLTPIEFDYDTKQILLIPFVCRIASGEIFLTEHVALRWMNFEDIMTIDWLDADRKLIQENLESLKLLI